MDLNVTILPVVTKDILISLGSRLTSSNRDASSALLQLINILLDFTYVLTLSATE